MALVDAQALRLALRGHHLEDGLRAYVAARRYHTWVYQTFSKMFTPQYQSDSKALPWLRDNLLYPLSTLPPAPYILRQMVMGTVLPPMAGLCNDSKA
jgi:2-polyprenyl-6-methoxyphenol hydroxylase-like FAD-dependent oxidoreductase